MREDGIVTLAGRVVPSLELLCYHQAAPMLRVVDPSTGDQRQFSAQKTFGGAVGAVLARDGWVAGRSGQTYAFGLGQDLKPRRFARGTSFVGSVDRRCIWIRQGRTWQEYDGVTDEFGREVPVAPGFLAADTAVGLVVVDVEMTVRLVDRDDPARELKRWPSRDRPMLAFDTTLVWRDADSRLLVEDLAAGTVVSIQLPLWRMHHSPAGPASLSPDRRWLALSGDAIVGEVPLDLPPRERERRKRQGSALVLVDLVDGRAVLVGGYFENFAYQPVWSADGASIFVGVPFEAAMYVATFDESDPQLRRVDSVERSAPMPMIDLRSAQVAPSENDPFGR